MKEKVVSLERLKEVLGSIRRGRKVVFTHGCFDLLGVGQVRYLQEAKKLGDILIVGIYSDNSIRRLKGESCSLIPEEERAEIVAALACVDYVVIFSEDTPSRLLMLLRPDICVQGRNYSFEDLPLAQFVESYGGKVVILDKKQGFSITDLIEKIKSSFGSE